MKDPFEELPEEIVVPSVTSPKIVDEAGNPIKPRFDVMNFLMQAAQTAQLVKLRKLEESKIPVGLKEFNLAITATPTEIYLSPPWIGLSLVNDGPGAITIDVNSVNALLTNAMIAPREPFRIDMVYPIIEWFCLRAAVGTVAAVRIYGKQGKPLW